MGGSASAARQYKPVEEAFGGSSDGSRPVTDKVVGLEDVIAKKGISIAVAGRYTTVRRLDQDYSLDSKVIGSGMSGPVQLATGRSGGQKYAVKSFRKIGLSARKREELKSEVEIYLALDHPHIARLEMVYETDEDIHLVMEFMAGGELYDRLSQRKQYSEECAAETTHMMLLAVAYLHGSQIAHRDLKLENFLYERKDSDHLKLIDFGFAKFWDRSTKMSQACGSVHYVAPEVLAHSYTERADLWSLGVIVYMLLTGSPPFHGSDAEVLKKVKSGLPHFGSRFVKLTDPARDFVKKLLVLDPSVRLSAAEALEHSFVKSRLRADEGGHLLDMDTLSSLRSFAHASHFKRAVLSMMAWSLSTEDRTELRELFLSMDKENKGTITHSQMKQLMEERFLVDSMEAEALFSSLDANNDDEIAYSEFLAAALQGRVKVHESIIRQTFERFDQDKCGLISVEDLRVIIGNTFEGADVEELIREADTSGDGKIDYDEFLAYFHQTDGEEEAAGQGPASPKSRKGCHTEKLAIVLDRLLEVEVEGQASPGPAGSPRTPCQPLARRSSTTPLKERE